MRRWALVAVIGMCCIATIGVLLRASVAAPALDLRRRLPKDRPENVESSLQDLGRVVEDISRDLDRLSDTGAVEGVAANHVRSEAVLRKTRRFYPQYANTTDTIFVPISSYRGDPRCSATLFDLHATAAQVNRVHFGVADFAAKGDKLCTLRLTCALEATCFTDNIRRRVSSPSQFRGESFARAAAMALYSGEAYVLVVRSHVAFLNAWDTALTRQHTAAKRSIEKPILTAAVATDGTSGVVCDIRLEPKTGLVEVHGEQQRQADGARGVNVVPGVSTDVLFTSAEAILETPFDPHVHGSRVVLDGLLSARLWTSGWDFVALQGDGLLKLSAPVEDNARPTWQATPDNEAHALRRGQYLLEVKDTATSANIIADSTVEWEVIAEADVYGMGSIRDIDAFWAFVGIDQYNRSQGKNWCRAGNESSAGKP